MAGGAPAPGCPNSRDELTAKSEAYGEFGSARVTEEALPARTTVFTALPRDGMLVEIDAMAV
ncbi:enamine deaminase RidA (YjgF/YER057c/UK114 family) [Actinoalloteichus hoggarensis]|uniref:Uncharacterized protein n=1 Tax=Actinoalloteichus hoggarensis TaxID=1470176 RepID=A0A221W7M1_9PSEU|nr:RidA family protein [Actinoalloteichus hoggarensis]ASO21744.1 hypothetical protein AHOG_20635 [Actinoalloteichus hoggarensis]MBB5922341.1 enamine deaminase RidA (YjgF/YER057c/UK114 family) [Actinoalloteichus hoggarensis]